MSPEYPTNLPGYPGFSLADYTPAVHARISEIAKENQGQALPEGYEIDAEDAGQEVADLVNKIKRQ